MRSWSARTSKEMFDMKLNVQVLPLIAVAAAFGTAGALAQRDHPKRAKPEGDAQSAMQSFGTNRRKEPLRERQQAADPGCWRCVKTARPGYRVSATDSECAALSVLTILGVLK